MSLYFILVRVENLWDSVICSDISYTRQFFYIHTVHTHLLYTQTNKTFNFFIEMTINKSFHGLKKKKASKRTKTISPLTDLQQEKTKMTLAQMISPLTINRQ